MITHDLAVCIVSWNEMNVLRVARINVRMSSGLLCSTSCALAFIIMYDSYVYNMHHTLEIQVCTTACALDDEHDMAL